MSINMGPRRMTQAGFSAADREHGVPERGIRRGAPADVVPVGVSDAERATTFMAASLLLDYPRADFSARLDAVDDAVASLPEQLAVLFTDFTGWARAHGLRAVEETYVATFDEQRRCALELSYYAVGDTRQRGQALLAFRELYRAAGFEQEGDELPDYLPAILELAARSIDDPVTSGVLPAHREGLEVLRTALYQRESPWCGIVTAVCAVLPEITDDVVERYQKLIRQGPPAELVGIHNLPFPTLQEARP